MFRSLSIVASILIFSFFAIAQQALDNDAIVRLVKAGLSEELILATVASKPGAYDTSTDGIIELKKAGVSDKIVAAVVSKSSTPPTPTTAPMPANPASNPDDPASPHEAGIYIFSSKGPAGSKMTMLEPSIYTQGKTGGVFASAVSYGIAKIKVKAVLRGSRANARAHDPQSTFYFYFEEQGAGLSHANSPIFGGTSTPNEYTLLRFAVKKETRETIVGKMNAYGASGGTDEKAVIDFKYTKLGPGIYRVTLSEPLKSGEYGFISGSGTAAVSPYAGAAVSNSRVFDFGMD